MRVQIEINRPRWLRNRPRWLVRTVAAAAAIALLVPAAAFAAHNFTDVPDNHFAHADIDAIRRAGITAGANCGATQPSFCPNNNVTRAQMAAFLNRGLGRVAQEHAANAPDIPGTGNAVALSSESILVPGTPGTGLVQYVKADAQVSLFSAATGCPCTFRIILSDGSTFSRYAYALGQAGPGGEIEDEISLSWVFPRPAGSTTTITFYGELYQSTGARADAYNVHEAAIILTTFPTAADGAVGTLSPGEAPPRRHAEAPPSA